MTKFNYTIKDEVGIHARPAGLLVKFVGGLKSVVTLKKGEKSVDSKRLFGIMGLGIKCGDIITFELVGDNSAVDAKSLESFCKENF